MTHGYANQIAIRALAAEDAPTAGSDELIEAQYAGSKSTLRPIYDTFVAAIRRFGPDGEFAPKKAYISLRRTEQFGLIQLSTTARIDVGLVINDLQPTTRLEPSGSFNAMMTRRVRVGSLAEIDQELLDWLKHAYQHA